MPTVNEATHHQSVAERLAAAIHNLPGSSVTLHEIRDLIGRDGLMLLVAFLSLVFLIPVSIPGVSTVFGGGILLIGLCRLFGRDLWLPRPVGRREIAADRLKGALHRGLRTFQKLERWSRPRRMPWMMSSRFAAIVVDLAIVIAALLLMAPFGFVPFSNTLPAIALLFLAIGSLQRDGLCVVAGYASIVATVAYFGILIGGGAVALNSLAQRILG